MPRPCLRRRVRALPRAVYFKPQGIALPELEEILLPLEGVEALRLADLEGLTSEEAAAGMGVSRHTFGRVLTAARAKVARALVAGAALRIEGGHYAMAEATDGSQSREEGSGARPLAASGESDQCSATAEEAMMGGYGRQGCRGGNRGRCGQGRGQGRGQGYTGDDGRGGGGGAFGGVMQTRSAVTGGAGGARARRDILQNRIRDLEAELDATKASLADLEGQVPKA